MLSKILSTCLIILIAIPCVAITLYVIWIGISAVWRCLKYCFEDGVIKGIKNLFIVSASSALWIIGAIVAIIIMTLFVDLPSSLFYTILWGVIAIWVIHGMYTYLKSRSQEK